MSNQTETQVENLKKLSTTKKQSALAVEAKGLVKIFGDNRAVDGVDLAIPTGSIYGLLGPNGAGKTTTINMLATLLKPDGGAAKIFGHDVQREAQIVRQLISVTDQDAALDEKLSAAENLRIFGMLLGLSTSEARKRATELLEEFGLTEAANRPVEKFSGGIDTSSISRQASLCNHRSFFWMSPQLDLTRGQEIKCGKLSDKLLCLGPRFF